MLYIAPLTVVIFRAAILITSALPDHLVSMKGVVWPHQLDNMFPK